MIFLLQEFRNFCLQPSHKKLLCLQQSHQAESKNNEAYLNQHFSLALLRKKLAFKIVLYLLS